MATVIDEADSGGDVFAPRRRWRRWLLPLLLLLPVPWLVLSPPRTRPESGQLRVTFLDVGQGDSAVIEGPTGTVVVIDGGGRPGADETRGEDPGSRVVVPYLRSCGINRVDLLVATHPDDDHIQGLSAVATRLAAPRGALICGYPGPSAPYHRLISVLRGRNVPLYVGRRGQRIDLGGGARLEVLAPTDRPIVTGHSLTNNNCLVIRLVYQRARFLFTGDAEGEEEADMLADPHCDLSADVLKVGHHGSRWSSTAAFLQAVHPSVGIISAGLHNTYGHPHAEVLERLRQIGAVIYRTDRQGAITVATDGTRLHFITTTPDRR